MFGINITWGCVLAIAVSGAYSFSAHSALAQITPDGTLPNNSVININGKIFDITGGTQAGRNLFHSFQEFSVLRGNEAHFNNAVDIQNIISRVTGSSISNIDGLIQVVGNANLFFINPNGIIFGPNARLDIGGSFIASTASSINFADGTQFSAKPSQNPPLLTITAPLGLNMGSNPGKITVQGSGHEIDYGDFVKEGPRDQVDTAAFPPGLKVKPEKTLALVGGEVSLEGGVLTSPAGRIEIGSFDSNQVVNLVPVQEGWKLGYEGTPNFRDIQFFDQALVNTTGNGSGSIAIRGSNINFTSESILLADTLGDKNGGEISIFGKEIVFDRSAIGSNTFSSGNAGQIKLDATNINFKNRSSASIQTANSGNAGNINITANSLGIEGESALVSITTENSKGKAGDINIEVADRMESKNTGITTDSKGTGDAGTINISANSLSSQISGIKSTVSNTGEPGEINLNVTGSLELRRTGVETNTSGASDAGKININANSLLIENSQVNSRTEEKSTGNAGEISVTAESLKIINLDNNPDLVGISATSRTGNGGNINLNIGKLLLLRGKSSISTTAGAPGSGGNGGNITINVRNGSIVTVPNENSDITANTYGGSGGKITINSSGIFGIKQPTQEELERLSTNGITEINPGNSRTNDITAISQTDPSFNGQVTINTPGFEPSKGFVELPTVLVDTFSLIDTSCGTFAGKEGSEFTITGRGGLPPSPYEPLSTDVVWSDTRLAAITAQQQRSETTTPKPLSKQPNSMPIVPATGWVFDGKGHVTLISHTSSSSSSGSTPAACPKQ
ncbi:filamentous hemagglutinin N-terminal domain-containing protein [Scytonema sp. PCC 10023]|uniref:two-partner secretion domain-containing protein n=1 Tax=Scytonema sp. PCC 10023 TaxID=1680591 RepID=UPI0039C5F21E